MAAKTLSDCVDSEVEKEMVGRGPDEAVRLVLTLSSAHSVPNAVESC